MGYQVKPTDEVKFDGSRVQQTPPVYLLLNKPKGFLATSQGGKIVKSVQDLIRSAVKTKVPPVGDMGRPMTGLLFFTNDEVLRKKLSNSKSISMIYQVLLDKNVTSAMMKHLKEGQIVFEKKQKFNAINHMDGKSKKEVGIEVHSLSPAIIVKLFAAVGCKVVLLDRVTYAGLTKKEQLANRIYKNTGLMTDDVLPVLPGAAEIIEDYGIFSPVKPVHTEEE